jgi:hypothetical protein
MTALGKKLGIIAIGQIKDIMKDLNGYFYNGEWTTVRGDNNLTPQEKLELLDWHPVFTGRCPKCEVPIRNPLQSDLSWHCGHCQWTIARSVTKVNSQFEAI